MISAHPTVVRTLAPLTLMFGLSSAVHADANDFALRLPAGSKIVVPYDPIMNTTVPVTMEMWVRADPGAGNAFGFTRYQGSAEHKALQVHGDGGVEWQYAGQPWGHGGDCIRTGPGYVPIDGSFHHVAFVRRVAANWDVYVDGTPVWTGSGGCCWSTCSIINSSAPTRFDGSDGWMVREFRVSSSARYDGAFTPESAWPTDADTAMLLAFDEGTGDQVLDGGPAAQVGQIQGSFDWVFLDCNGNGVPDSDDIANGTSQDCDADGQPDECQIAEDPSRDWNGDGVLDTCSGPNYCVAAANSTGAAAVIGASGSPVAAENGFTLEAEGLPLHEFGYFLASESTAFVPGFGGSSGNLCLGAPQIRFNISTGGGKVLNSGSTGTVSFTLDLDLLPQGITFDPGETWFFQLWHRDWIGGAPTSNTTDGIEVMFR